MGQGTRKLPLAGSAERVAADPCALRYLAGVLAQSCSLPRWAPFSNNQRPGSAPAGRWSRPGPRRDWDRARATGSGACAPQSRSRRAGGRRPLRPPARAHLQPAEPRSRWRQRRGQPRCGVSCGGWGGHVGTTQAGRRNAWHSPTIHMMGEANDHGTSQRRPGRLRPSRAMKAGPHPTSDCDSDEAMMIPARDENPAVPLRHVKRRPHSASHGRCPII